MLKKLGIFILLWTLSACDISREYELHVLDIERERFSFLIPGKTNMDEVLTQFGAPTITFENETILAYKLLIFKEPRSGRMCWASSEILAFPAFRVLAIDSREEVLVSGPLDIYSHVYELILVFGKKNILKEYSINSPEFITDCGYTR